MSLIEVKVPDIGDFKEVEVIELMVKPGDTIKVDQSLIAVESDKASMEIPSSHAGVVKELKVKLGDKIAEGSLVLILEASEATAAATAPAPASTAAAPAAPAPAPVAAPVPAPVAEVKAPEPVAAPAPVASAPAAAPTPAPAAVEADGNHSHASPSVRKLARELGIDLQRVKGSGPKDRITPEDIHQFVKAVMAGSTAAAAPVTAAPAAKGSGVGLDLLPWPSLDFSKFGSTELQPLTRIMKISGPNLHRNWVMIPHVTNHEDADITDLEAFRLQLNAENAKAGVKLTMLAFLIKACVAALKKFPEFNSSLDGENLILKQYYHIGFAADTPNGLVVPVVRNADQKGIFDIARETAELAAKAREGKLGIADMQGGTFSISSLGGIGGTYFTPIINAPEVAILGVCRASRKPVWNDTSQAFEPRLIMPLSLSWDHRVIDGAAAARFNAFIAQLMADFRRAML